MLVIQPLCEELQKVANEELGEVPERVPEDLQTFKLWIEQQPHLNARTDEQFLIQFLRGCKYSLEKAKDKIDYFYALRTKYADTLLLTDVDEPELRKWHAENPAVALPTPLHGCGPRIVINKPHTNAKNFSPKTITKHCVAMFELMMLKDPYSCIYGIVFVIDCAELTMAHLAILTPSMTKTLVTCLEKTLPLRIKSILLINIHSAAEQLYNIVKPLLPDKFLQKIHLCGKNLSSLYEHIPKKYLPEEYGGDCGPMSNLQNGYENILDEYRDYFEENKHYGTDESLRLNKSLDLGGELGIEGSFRKLEVD